MLSQRRSLSVASAIRKRIVRGEFRPGSQLPTWDCLEEEYSVGRNTLVRAISKLKEQRYIYSSSTRGTYVVERPPHLSNYALVFHDRPGIDPWNRFWAGLTERAAEFEVQRACRITIKYGVRDEYNNEALRQLVEEVEGDQYAGVIYVGEPDRIGPQILRMRDLPQVVIMSKCEQANLPKVDIDRPSFVAKTVDWLRARGHKKVAILSSQPSTIHDYLHRGILDAGFDLRPEWFLSASASYPATAEPIIRLLLCSAQPDLPDALVISNDNLVDPALAAVVAMGKRVPEELDLLTHCNWPTQKGHIVPTTRLGYDVRDLLGRCIRAIDDRRAGRDVPEVIQVPALFEDEIRGGHT